MADRHRSVDHLLPLSQTVLHLLLALADGPRHGYALMQDVRALSSDKVRLWPARLYGALREMEKLGFIAETDRRPPEEEDDQRRRYFELTALGRRVLAAEVARLEGLIGHALASRSLRRGRA